MASTPWTLSVLFCATFAPLACGVGAGNSPPQTAPSPSSTSSVVVPTTYVSSKDASTLPEMFERAKVLLLGGKFAEAASAFDRVAQLEPNGSYAPAAIFNAGLAYDELEDRARALAHFRDLARRFPAAPETHPALIRTLRLLAFMEKWSELISTSELIISHADALPVERLEGHGSRALGAIEQNDLDAAAAQISKARTILEDQHLDDGGRLPIGTAPAFFALGELRRIKGERIVFVPVPANFSQALEDRCQLLLDAQDGYVQAMRTYDAHWAAMSGYRVGQLYQKLHQDLLAVPAPASAKTERQRQLFEGAMRLRYRVLLEKGLQMLDRTLAMAQRTGEHSVWVLRARDAQTDMSRALAQEKDALKKLPWTEAQLQQALDDLSAKKAPSP
jgi:tetratricopeptide (TPR) repeat protein